MRGLALLLIAACTPATYPPTSESSSCDLGAPLPADRGTPVANYPLALELDDAGQAAARAALEAKAPGWTITVDKVGYPSLLTAPAGTTPSDDTPRVTAVITALRGDLGVGPKFRVTPNGTGWSFQTDTSQDAYIAIGGNTVEQRIELHIYRVIPLPAAFTRIPIAEFYRRWNITASRAVELEHSEEGHPCDPVHSASDCAGAGPRTTSSCWILRGRSPDSLEYDVVRTDAGYRWVVELYLPSGCPTISCKLTAHIPLCGDAITGEILDPAICGFPK